MVQEERSTDGGEDDPTFRYSLDDEGQPLVAIVGAVAWVKGVDVRELKPLHQVVDVDELRNHLESDPSQFTRSNAESNHDEREVTFHYEGCEVTVGRGTIRVRPD